MPKLRLIPDFIICCQHYDCFGDADLYRKGEGHLGEENTGYLLCPYHALQQGFCWDCGEWFEYQLDNLNHDQQSVNFGRCSACEEKFNANSLLDKNNENSL